MEDLDDEGIFIGVSPQRSGMERLQPNRIRKRNDLAAADNAIRTALDFTENGFDLLLHRFWEEGEEYHPRPFFFRRKGKKLIENRAKAAGMVRMKVGDQNHIKPIDPHLAEERGDARTLLRPPPIDQNRSPFRQAEHDRLSVSDIEEADL